MTETSLPWCSGSCVPLEGFTGQQIVKLGKYAGKREWDDDGNDDVGEDEDENGDEDDKSVVS